jgi:hypothetical protein
LDQAKARYNETGFRADTEWFLNMEKHHWYLCRKHQIIMRELGKRRKSEDLKRNITLERIFIRLVKDVIPKDEYLRLWQQAKDEYGNNDQC